MTVAGEAGAACGSAGKRPDKRLARSARRDAFGLVMARSKSLTDAWKRRKTYMVDSVPYMYYNRVHNFKIECGCPVFFPGIEKKLDRFF